jgi:hypothetical protein
VLIKIKKWPLGKQEDPSIANLSNNQNRNKGLNPGLNLVSFKLNSETLLVMKSDSLFRAENN